MRSQSTQVLLALAGLLIGAALGASALYDLIVNGPFSWHVSQPRYAQGLIEIAALTCISALAIRFTRVGISVAILAGVFYARRLAIDYAIVVSGIYVLGIFSLGFCVRKALLLPKCSALSSDDWGVVETIVIGLAAFSCFQWLLGGMGIGYDSFVLVSWTVAAASIAIAFFSTRPSTSTIRRHIHSQSTTFIAPAVLISLVFLGFAAIAKTNTGLESDSAWYGIRPDRVLFTEHGVFGSAQLIALVHYYPKTYELLITPLSDTGDNSTVPALGVWAWGFLILVASTFLRRMGVRRTLYWCALFVIGTLPAALNIAATAKGDVLAAALTMVGAVSIILVARKPDLRLLSIGAAALFLAPFMRITVLPYAGLLGLALIATWIILFFRHRPNLRETRGWLVLPALALISSLAAIYRTYALSGVPFIAPGELQQLALSMGATLRFPVAPVISWNHVPIPSFWPLLQDFLFHPSKLPHVLIYWTGNAWAALFVLAAIGLICFRRDLGFDGAQRLALAVSLCTSALFFIFLLTMHFGIRGGDGNYFIVPILLLIATTVTLARRFPALIAGLCVGAGAVQASVFFMSSLWQTGTRAFDLDMDRNPIDQARFVSSRLDSAGLGSLNRVLESCNSSTLVLGMLPRPQGYLLPVRYEPIQEVAWSNKSFVASSDAFADYLGRTEADIVVLPRRAAPPGTQDLLEIARQAASQSESNQNTPLRVGTYDLYSLSSAGAACINMGFDRTSRDVPPTAMLFQHASKSIHFQVIRQPCDASNTSLVQWHGKPAHQTFFIFVRTEDGDETIFAAVRGSGERQVKWVRTGTTFLIRNSRNTSTAPLGSYTVGDAVCI